MNESSTRRKRKKRYDFSEMAKVEAWVESRFPQVRGSAAHAYFLGLRRLEIRKGVGVGGAVLASFDEWGEASYLNRRTAKSALESLSRMGLVEFKIGKPRKGEASMVRRKPAGEISRLVPKEILVRHMPEEAAALAEELAKQGVPWGGGTFFPAFSVAVTGRIYMSKPNLQAENEQTIASKLAESLKPGERLVHADYAQAEPTILIWDLRNRGLLGEGIVPSDVYDELCRVLCIHRGKAKGLYGQIVYGGMDPRRRASKTGVPEDGRLAEFIDAVARHREELWTAGKPSGQNRRHVHTLLGRRIEAPPGRRVHRGTILAWRTQGTVADIFNLKLKALLALQKEGSLRLLLQQHDGVWVSSGTPSVGSMVKDVMEGGFRLPNLSLLVKVSECPLGFQGGREDGHLRLCAASQR